MLRFLWRLFGPLAALSGCSTFPHKDHKVDPVKPRALPPPVARTDGAIYQAGQEMALFADLKARRIGDVLTIVLNEATTASKNAKPRPRRPRRWPIRVPPSSASPS